MAFKDTQPYLMNGGKIDPLSEIRNAGIVTSGSVVWVKVSTDVDYVPVLDQVGRDNMRNDVQSAVDALRSDMNDYIMVCPQNGGTSYGLGTALDIDEDRLHIVGVGHTKSKQTYTTTISGAYGTTPDSEVVYVTGNGVEVSGLRFLGTLGTNGGGTMTNGVAYIAGGDFWAKDCVFEDSTASWGTPPVVTGKGTTAHDARFDNCKFALTGGANVESAGNAPLVLGGNGNKRWEFNSCSLTLTAGSVTETFFTPGTGAKEITTFNNCLFACNGTTHSVASAIRGSTTANNPVLLNYCGLFSVAVAGTDPNVFAIPTQSGTNAAGLHNPNKYYLGTVGVPAA